jgi:hypothetical protein
VLHRSRDGRRQRRPRRRREAGESRRRWDLSGGRRARWDLGGGGPRAVGSGAGRGKGDRLD